MDENSKEYFFIINLNITEDDNGNEIKFQQESNYPINIFQEKLEDEKLKNVKLIKIFKFFQKDNEKKKTQIFDFSYGDKNYKLTLNCKDKTFIFEPLLQQSLTRIEQSKIEYADKMNYFKKSLNKSNESDKIDILYKDSIKLYSNTKNLQLLINIFINVYNNTPLCSILLEEFNKSSTDKKLLEKELTNKNIEKIKNDLDNIYKNKGKLVSSHSLNKIDFYGLILFIYNNCFIQHYEDKINELYKSGKDTLIEILLKYKNILRQTNIKKEI